MKKSTRPGKKTVAPVEFIEPMQCKPVTRLPEGPEWLYELKLDGYRCEIVKNGIDVKLLSRNGKPLTAQFPEIVHACASLPATTALLDGEVVMLDEQGRPSFQLLQRRATGGQSAIYYAFDLLNRDGASFTGSPLEKRRAALRELLADTTDPIRFSGELEGSAEVVTAAVAHLGLEGVIAKRRQAIYEPGERTGSWCKYRTNNSQAFVIGGYIPGTTFFESLLVGYYDGEKLIYCARVKNGFVSRIRTKLGPELKRRKTSVCPFANLPESKGGRWGESITTEKMKQCVWVTPELVCQVEFLEWTAARHLRHSSFAGMRTDTAPSEVTREV